MPARLVRLAPAALLLALAALLPVCDLLFARPDRAPRKVAFLVGVAKYDHDFPNLNFPERDVEELDKVLRAGGFEVVTLTGSAAGKDRATKKNIEARLQALLDGDGDDAKKIRKGDLVLVALSGHGQQVKDKGRDVDDPYFVPVDGMSTKPATLVSINHLVDELMAPHGARNLLLVDACRDIADPNKGKGVEGQDIKLKGETAVLFSCSRGEKSFENADLKHGVFTYAVLKGLKTGATAGGEVTWKSLTSAVEEEMAGAEFKKLLPPDVTQTPVAPSGQVPRTVLLTAAAAPKKGPRDSDPPPSDVAKGETEQEFEYVIDGSKKKGKCAVLAVDVGDGVKMELVRVKAGKFQMGSPKDQKDRSDNEGPQREVEITKDFYLGRFEVTQAQYKAVAGENPSKFKGDRLPVEMVSWDDAVKFCDALGKKLKRTVVLPTEAQWEFACRAGTTTPFHFGSKLNGDFANHDGNYSYDTDTKGAYKEKTTEVGSYPANPWGLHDMSGNVTEWCRDRYDAYHKVQGRRDPVQLAEQAINTRVWRGGAWGTDASRCRAAARGYGSALHLGRHIGFRVCVPLD